MSGSNRSERLKDITAKQIAVFFGFFLILWLSLGIFYSGQLTGYIRGQKDHNSTEYSAHAHNEIKSRCISLEGMDLAECVIEVIDSTNEEKRSERDIVAQQEMSLWGLWMAVISTFMLIVTGFAAYWVKEALGEAKKTTNAALVGAEQARLANEIAAKNLINSHRPWLVIENDFLGDFMSEPFQNDSFDFDQTISWVFHYWFRNRGKSTAHIKEVRYKWFCDGTWYKPKKILQELVDGKIGHRLSGKNIVFASEKTNTLPSTGWARTKSETPDSKYYSLIICVKYTDDTGTLNGVDARCFILQQINPGIGPLTREYRADDSVRILT